MPNDRAYFLALVTEDERLTKDLTDDMASVVIEFAEYLATKIANKQIDRNSKEMLFQKCMLHLHKLSKAIVECLEGVRGAVDRIETELAAAMNTANQISWRNNG
jgi:hypothetical protein